MEQHTKLCIPVVTLSSDMMSAKLKLHQQATGLEFSVDDLKRVLQDQGVKTGISEDALRDMIEHDIYDTDVEVARGKAPEKGKDGSFTFYFENAVNDEGPKELEDGSVEYISTTEYTIVEEGDLLAEYIPATNGVYGYSVDNKMLTPMRGKEQPPLRGNGFRKDENKYYALQHGKFERTDMGIYITNLLEVKETVDISYGHIDFDGDVYIRGDVKSGMNVKATGNIEIKGHVGNCQIVAGKDIIIRNGMQGKFSGKLQAGGEISCKFFENSQASAVGNISVRSVMNSTLETQGKVIVEGKESVVLGGSIHAVQGMDIREAGNDLEVETILAAGALPGMLKRDAELAELIKKTEGEVELLDRSIKILDRMEQTKVAKESANRKLKIIQAKVIRATDLKKYQEEKSRSEALLKSGQEAQIIVRNNVYPGCLVEIAGIPLRVRQKAAHVKFTLKDGDVRAILLY